MSETRFAILIGINDYEFNSLDYCVKDSNDVRQCFVTHCNIVENNMFSINSSFNNPVYNIQETFEIILKRIEANFNQGNDTIFFYFSGHGLKADGSTKLSLKNQTITLQDIFLKFAVLKPKFIFFLIDSCYSGVGIMEEIGKSEEAYNYYQHLSVATGYNIFCASAYDKSAKEDTVLENGRFTKIFIDIVNNKSNYNNGLLNLSNVYQLIDEKFKNNPEFRQLPFSQNKGLSTYPLAYLNGDIEQVFYSNHYISDVEEYDWDKLTHELRDYCNIGSDIIIEFIRLCRELVRNSKTHGKASFTKIELTNNAVCIIDNSNILFDIFNPPSHVIEGGGLITAKEFSSHFASFYNYSVEKMGCIITQRFHFQASCSSNNVCEANFSNIMEFRKVYRDILMNIPNVCKNYEINMPRGTLDLSTCGIFFRLLHEQSIKRNIPIIVKIPDQDILKKQYIAFNNNKNLFKGDVVIE